MPNFRSCGTLNHVKYKCIPCVKCTPCPPPEPPACRGKSIKDACRVKPCPPCKYKCPPPPCVKKTKCKVPTIKDKCRTEKPCPEPVECCPSSHNNCECVGAGYY